jgi:hypothetical protein
MPAAPLVVTVLELAEREFLHIVTRSCHARSPVR